MNDVFEELKKPAHAGQLRSRSWRYLIEPMNESDPTWAERARQYWLRQEKRFGLEMADFMLEIDRDEHIVTTYSVVMRVLPGKRVPQATHQAIVAG